MQGRTVSARGRLQVAPTQLNLRVITNFERVETHPLNHKTLTVLCYYITTKSKLQQQIYKNYKYF